MTVAGHWWSARAHTVESRLFDSFSVDETRLITCNLDDGCPVTPVEVSVMAYASLKLDMGESGSSGANAYADPVISIDPGFADAHLFDIVFSPGVIPVPAAVWLFSSGILGLIGLARRG